MENVSGGGGPTQLSAEAIPQLKEGISLVLSRWSALQMAVVSEWGGRDSRSKSEQLAEDIFSWFSHYKEPHYVDDLENLLDEAMLSLNTMIEDGSIEEVAEKLMIMHEECLEGNYKSVESLREDKPRAKAVPHIRQVVNDDDDDDDDDESMGDDDESMGGDDSLNMIMDMPDSLSNSKPADMSVDEPRPTEAAEAEDGWVVVASKRNRGKRN